MDAFKRAVHLFRARDASIDAPVKGEQRSLSGFAVAMILLSITVAYVFLEIRWNSSFMSTLYEGTADRDEINALVQEGRWLAAFGLAWALMKGVFVRESTTTAGFVVSVALVLGSTMLAYVGISRGYEAVIDAIPQDEAALLYKSTAHRALALSGSVQDESAQDPMSVALWALKVLDVSLLQGIDQGFEAQAEDAKTQLLAKVSQDWPKIQAELTQVAAAPKMKKLFEDGHITYLEKSRMTLSYVSGWQEKREKEFQRLTGMRPNAKATKEQYARELLNSNIENHRAMGRMYLQTKSGTEDLVVYQAGDLTVRLSEVINIKSERDLLTMVERKFKERVAHTLSSPELLKKADARDGIAAAILPPVALLLSAVAILMNVGTVVGLVISQVPVLRAIPQWVWPAGALAGSLVWATPTSSLPGLEGGFAWIRLSSPVGSWLFERLLSIEYLLLSIAL